MEDKTLWERQPWENQTSWALFQHYLNLEAPRTLTRAYALYRAARGLKEAAKKDVPGSYRNLAQGKRGNGDEIPGSVTFEVRAMAFDDHVAALEREKWIKRKLALRESEWEAGSALIERAKQMLMFPVVKTVSEDGQTIIFPAGWKFSDIPGILAAGSKIARLSADMVTDKVALDWRAEALRAGIDPTELENIYATLVEELASQLAENDDESGNAGGETEGSASE